MPTRSRFGRGWWPTRSLWILLSLVLGVSVRIRGDVVHLKSGGTREGTVVSQDDKEVVLEITRRNLKARLRIPISEVERVEKVASPKEEYEQRLKAIAVDDANAWEQLGLWCEQKGLADEARECLRKALNLNPDLKGVGEKLGLLRVAGKWTKFDDAIAEANNHLKAGKVREAATLLLSLRDVSPSLDSLKRREVNLLLCRCYELDGDWPKALEVYDDLLKSYSTLTPEVAVIRVKQRLIKEHPDGMIPIPAAQAKPREAGQSDLVKAVGEGVAKLIAPKSVPKVSLADPKVMEAAIRSEAEAILQNAEELVKKADGQALSEKILHAANPLENLHRLVDTLPRLMHLGSTLPRNVSLGPADETYARAEERALDADLLVRDISKPLRLTIAKKRLARIDEFIARAKEQLQAEPLYIPPPAPGAPPDPSAKARLFQLNATPDKVERLRQITEALDKLYAVKLVVLRPVSDDLIAEVQKNEKDREALADTKAKLQTLADLARDLKESERLLSQMQQAWAKAQANHPNRFQYTYQSFQSPDGLYHFRDKGKSWRARCDACIAYCNEALELARKRRALLSKYPERPQTPGELESIKQFMVSVYNYKVSVSAMYNKKGGA